MATTTTRSPSPNPSRPRTPDARKSCTAIASAFSEPRQRSAGCKSGAALASSSRASLEQSENERDLNCSASSKPSAVRARSPAPSSCCSAKGAKNFMAPTISAASKAVAASPRRRILAERNETVSVVRSSLTPFLDEYPVPEEVPAKRRVSFGARPHQDSGVQETSYVGGGGSEPRKIESEIKDRRYSGVLSSFQISPAAIAPLDADPSLPPYDPHTNYLSPRPRFLHYRPNPRIEQYLNQEEGDLMDAGDGKRLEDSFSSESSEETPGQTEEEQQSTPGDDECSSPEVEPMEEEIGDSPVPEPESDPKSTGKGRSFWHYKFASLLLVLGIACIFGSFLGCPILSTSMPKTPVIPAIDDVHVRDYLAVAASDLKELARKLSQWSSNSFARHTTPTSLPREEFGPIFMPNMTAANIEQREDIDYSYIGTIVSNEHIGQGNAMVQPFEGEMQEESMEEHEVDIDHTYSATTLSNEHISQVSEMEQPLDRSVQQESMEVHEVDVSGDELKDDRVSGDEKSGTEVAQGLEENDVPVLEPRSSVVEFESEKKIAEADDTKEMEEEAIVDGIESEKNIELELRKMHESSLVEFESEKKIAEADDTKEMEEEAIVDGIESEKNIELELRKMQDIGLHDLVSHHDEVAGGQGDTGSSSSSASQTHEDSPSASQTHDIGPHDLVSQHDAVAGGQGDSGSSSSSSASQTHEDSPSASGDERISNTVQSQDLSMYGSDGKHAMKLAAGLSSAVLLVACFTFLLMKQRQTPLVDNPQTAQAKKVITKSVSGSSESHGHARGGSPFQNTPVVDMLMMDSGPSEFSSSLQHSTSVGRRRATRKGEEEETESNERRLRRDSTVSSSSISYGSFTTYEKLSSKKGSRDEEVITPVRRSSRIRNQIASP
ncbi:hypothetical protein OPV22_032991 [Ensete ventricosum]|uniref:Uncharacterized protein n=1 Tax=Ensete ventricosum TaxID=4639 RepID=A0AAV8PYV5_ENSVE|nr:hypothetical protein OPV22_032991 [Ensete ventricosum]